MRLFKKTLVILVLFLLWSVVSGLPARAANCSWNPAFSSCAFPGTVACPPGLTADTSVCNGTIHDAATCNSTLIPCKSSTLSNTYSCYVNAFGSCVNSGSGSCNSGYGPGTCTSCPASNLPCVLLPTGGSGAPSGTKTTSGGSAFPALSCGGDATKDIDTAIGCVPVDKLDTFVNFILRWIFGAAGGIVVLTAIGIGYTYLTSQGNPEKLKEVQQMVVSVLSGLLLIMFSLVLLKAIGADIFGLPGFI